MSTSLFTIGNVNYSFVALGPAAANSSVSVTRNGQSANGVSSDVLSATIRNAANSPIANTSVTFAATSGVKFGSGTTGAAGSCTTDANGSCSVDATSTTAANYASQVSAGSVTLGTLNYNFVALEPSAGKSSIAVTTNGQIANGSDADVLQATIRDSSNYAVPGATVTFAATPGVRFGSGAYGAAGSCATNTSGVCSVDATSTVAADYSSSVAVGGSAIGSLGYNFVAGAASAAHSGVRVVTDDALADGVQADVLEVLIRDANDNPVGSASVAFASPGLDVAFTSVTRGSAGSCITAATGLCRVEATSSNASGSSKSSAVTVGGTALSGRFTASGNSYGPSPVVFKFAAPVARLQIVKQVTNGSGSATFDFRLTGLQSTSDSITVSGSGSANGAALLGQSPPRPVTITEVATAAWPDAPVAASCVDLNGTDPAETFGTLDGNQLVIPASRTPAGANLRCTFVNSRGSVISGKLFDDIGAAGGTANDGIANGSEAGLPGVVVTVGNCATQTFGSLRTAADGSYRIGLPAGLASESRLCVDTPRAGASRISTGGSVGSTALPAGSDATVGGIAFGYSHEAVNDRIAFAWPGGTRTSVDNLNFGSVPASSLMQAGTKNGRPGASVNFGHIFLAGTAGTVNFSIAESVATPAASGWTEKIYADADCSGVLQAGAALLYPPGTAQTVTAGQKLCLVVQEAVPAQASVGDRNRARVRADLQLVNSTPALSARYELDDLTTVASEGVDLRKEVRNVTQGATAFGQKNEAKPGDVLEYRVTYANNTPVPVHHLVISDSTPAFTSFASASAVDTPASLGRCTKLTPGGTVAVACSQAQTGGGKGAMSWNFEGPLQPGGTGTVLFSVVID
ncbi:Ig-like domain-containing protein [Xylophilus sp. GOD-11R]|uniref:Ig-like domain-containing protein n=1 Tax=Xylophilus sp. GOD-11R TaxID=3089814 RepID=UPI00298C7899|nr:Ig-like domain-containing protein [Xylophilus sp. GOD-11R]WPB56498.1 Ig-like domain-containing protein [Xylophilus sp. GOD-11R]